MSEAERIINECRYEDMFREYENEDPSIDELFEDEARRILEQLKYGGHADSDEYRRAVDSLNEFLKARATYNAGAKEGTEKETSKPKNINWDVIVPILIKAGMSLAAIIFWILLEQNRVAPRNLASWVDKLLTPRF